MAKKLEQAALDGNGPTYVSRDMDPHIERALDGVESCPVADKVSQSQGFWAVGCSVSVS
jgi:hypothetical protein